MSCQMKLATAGIEISHMWEVYEVTVLHTSVKVNRPLAGHIVDHQGEIHGLCVYAKALQME